jgi:hypothetical protein
MNILPKITNYFYSKKEESMNEKIGLLSKKLDIKISESVAALYEKKDGEKPDTGGFRLMSINEIIETPFDNVLSERKSFLVRTGFVLCPFWTNDNSDYIALYMNGPLENYSCFVFHDDQELSLSCGDVPTLIKKIKALRKSEGEPSYPREFGERLRVTPEASERDKKTVKRLVEYLKEKPASRVDEPYFADYMRDLALPKGNEDMRKALKESGLSDYAVLKGEELMFAVTEGKIDEVEDSLEAGVDVNEVVTLYGTIISRAAAYGWLDIVKLALSKGADVNIPEKGAAIKYAEAKDKNIEIFELLISAGVDLEGNAAKNALENAVRNKAVKIEKLLKSEGVNIN